MSREIRISTPEFFYDQLKEPNAADPVAVWSELGQILNIIPEKDIPSLNELSQALIEESCTTLAVDRRDNIRTGRHLIGMLRRYPWLQPKTAYDREEADITSMNLSVWAGNHLFDDYPGLFGITEVEGGAFRALVENYRSGETNDDFALLCSETGVKNTHLTN